MYNSSLIRDAMQQIFKVLNYTRDGRKRAKEPFY